MTTDNTHAPAQPVIAPWVMLTDDETYDLAEPFGSFEYGDAQGHKRIAFSRAIQAAFISKQGATE